jgi:hypothetical protein
MFYVTRDYDPCEKSSASRWEGSRRLSGHHVSFPKDGIYRFARLIFNVVPNTFQVFMVSVFYNIMSEI